MKFFIDTANLEHIREAVSWGIIDGCTTNPSLIAKEGRDFVEAIAEICTLVDGPVSAETVADTAEEMVAQGRLLAKIHDNVVIKVPLTEAGIESCSILSSEGIGVNVTLCFSTAQALVAAKAGAKFVSPFVGRLDDLSQDGMQLIQEIVDLYANYPNLKTEVLAASMRHPLHVSQAAMVGSDVATIPYPVLKKLFHHPLTDKGNAQFTADWMTVDNTDIIGQVSDWLERNGRA
jgi:transaldolase